MRYPSLEPLLSKKYFDGLLSTKIDELEKNIELAKNKKIQITSQFEIPIEDGVKRFETLVIPEIRNSCQLMIKKIDEIRSIKEGTERQLLAEGHVSNINKKILIYIQQQNIICRNPTYGEISKYMELTSRSIRKRLRSLIEYGYLIDIKTGRMKNLMITERGKNALIIK